MGSVMSSALIVGASRGLGRGLAREHRRRGWDVLATVRGAEDVGEGIRVETLDVTRPDDIDALGPRLPHDIERLFVVAGVAGPMDPIGAVATMDFDVAMHANVLGPLLVVDRLTDQLAERATVAVMSSMLGSIAANETGNQEVYRISKAALNMGLRSVAARRSDARTYLAVNPGYVRTDMTGGDADLSVDDAVTRVVDVLDARAGTGGVAFVDNDGGVLPW